MRPLLQDRLPVLGTPAAHRWEFVSPAEGPARVDDHAGAHHIAACPLFRRQRRVEITRRHIDHLRLALRIPARRYCPQHFIDIGDVDIVVYDHDHARIAAAVTRREHSVSDLARVARIALAYGDSDDEPPLT